ncbi:MAG TPA: CHAT domain-containing protein [Thermoanaerobaculia bacterium]|jgi:tetratricopeptide (TPR) repeat protein|nr:CHAT domain-containing protein [Thermoanaerobaculia bacterium]
MKYENFSMRIEPVAGNSYAVSVQSPQGEGRETFQLPRLGEPPWAGARPGRTGEIRDLRVPLSTTPEAPALDTGKELFQALFRGEVANLFHSSLGSLRGRHQGLRIDVSINPRRPELAPLQKLPWELLCRPETEDFLCLSRRTPVVRSLEAHRERRSAIARPRRLRILVVAASPTDCASLAVARERASLEAAWKGQEKKVEIVFLERGGVEEMRQALLAAPFHILHFMGHGKFDEESSEGVLFFERYDGTGQPFEGRRLAQLLHDFESLRLVVLNACHTAEAAGTHGSNPFAGAASSLVMGGVPAVVAMSGPVSDLAAVAFSRTFYQRLASGDAIDAAVTEGRLAIQRADPGDGAWAIPALFLRSPDGMLFAPRSTVWARRAALLAGVAVALSLVLILASGLLREHHNTEVTRLTNDGIGLLELGRKEEARKAFRSALDIDPDNAATLGNLANVETQLGDDEAALVHLQAAVRAAPGEAVHHYNLGNLLAFRKRYEEALPNLLRAIEIDPDYANAYNELGNVYLELDRPAEARKAFEAGLKRDRTLAKLHKNLARAALAEGDPEEAISHLKTALSLYSPADPDGKSEATYWLAAAQAAAGHATEACVALQTFETLDPRLLGPFAKNATLLAGQNRCAPWS